MLSQLSIRHYALIDFLDIEFTDGLNILTGETGSGKSIILGALGLILGERAEKRVVWKGEKKCIVEGTFSLEPEMWKAAFESNDLDFDTKSIFRREVLVSGKSRAFINDTPVTLKLMKEFGLKLVDIHSQHQTIRLNDPQFQLGVLDAFTDLGREKIEYQNLYTDYRSKLKRINELENRLVESEREKDFLQFQLGEFESLNLDEIDEAALEEEFNLLSNSEEIAEKLNGLKTLLNDGDTAIIDGLNRASSLLEDLSDYASVYKDLSERLKSVVIELDDMATEVDRLDGEVEINPNRLAQIDEVRSAIFRLEKKHLVSGVSELINRRDELKRQSMSTHELESELESLRRELALIERKLIESAEKLREKRLKSASRFSEEVETLLGSLNMKKAKFEVGIEPLDKPGPEGLDVVEMRFSANPGHSAEPLRKVASGGELSRLMLAIKRLSVSDQQTVILDEIDTGVAGEVAHSMGAIMKGMGRNRRVIAITHLPQIASTGESHFKVFKEEKEGVARTRIERLSGPERIEEIAQMLSGAKTTKAALDNARDLLHAN